MRTLVRDRLNLIVAAGILAFGLLGLASALVIALSHDRAIAADGNGTVAVGNVPAGTVVPFAGSVVPPGWLIADGSPVSQTQFPELFAAIGATYGVGPSGTFRLPDLRGRGVVGLGLNSQVDALGKSDGLAVEARRVTHKHGRGTLSASGGSHSHSITDPGHSHSITDPGHAHGITDPGHTHTLSVPLGIYYERGSGGPRDMPPSADGRSDFAGITATRATTGITVNSHTTGITGTNAAATGITGTDAAAVTLPTSAFSGTVGDPNGPTDGSAYEVLYYIIKT